MLRDRSAAVWMGMLLGAISVLSDVAIGQPVARGAGPDGPPRGGMVGGANVRGSGGMGVGAAHRREQFAAIKEMLGVSDEEWKALHPLIEKVIVAKFNTNTGAGMSWTSSNNSKPVLEASNARPDTPPGKTMQDIRDIVADDSASDEQLAQKIAAGRESRKAARAAYDAAQQELLAKLTPRRQAILMTLGIVE